MKKGLATRLGGMKILPMAQHNSLLYRVLIHWVHVTIRDRHRSQREEIFRKVSARWDSDSTLLERGRGRPLVMEKTSDSSDTHEISRVLKSANLSSLYVVSTERGIASPRLASPHLASRRDAFPDTLRWRRDVA
ncbi:Uncharacterized protein DBV15_07661 [Temnothorax longispinosus]|uniref:Uncharacterized protein n=1 Tax=Temnothorax longispinosus TaxID=300112 RepID=A0A4S2KJM1_9HYME|nr:Uncharacterized protein DBV15_07661 [Temnothorax longispinosus]